MKLHPLSFVAITMLSATACSGPRSPKPAARAGEPSAAATTVAPRDLAKEDLNKLQGTWRIESSVWNGVRESAVARSVTILFQDDKFIVVDKDGNRQVETIKLMPDQNPKAIDSWSKGADQPSPGIYSLEGDTLRWCSAGGSKKVRPTAFASKPGSKQSLVVLRRKES
jgi:uncharacterized protein (TIGR03067 family)